MQIFHCLLIYTLTFFSAGVYTSKHVCAQNLQIQPLNTAQPLPGKEQILLGVRVTVEKGWHLYAPSKQGRGGYSPSVTWQRQDNIKNLQIVWPHRKRLKTPFGNTKAYEGSYILPIVITLEKTAAPFHLAGDFKGLVCQEVCQPQKQHFVLDNAAMDNTQTGLSAEINSAYYHALAKPMFPKLMRLMGLAFIAGILLSFMPSTVPFYLYFVLCNRHNSQRRQRLLGAYSGLGVGMMLLYSWHLWHATSGNGGMWIALWQIDAFEFFMSLFIMGMALAIWGYLVPEATRIGGLMKRYQRELVFAKNFLLGLVIICLTPIYMPRPLQEILEYVNADKKLWHLLLIGLALLGGVLIPYLIFLRQEVIHALNYTRGQRLYALLRGALGGVFLLAGLWGLHLIEQKMYLYVGIALLATYLISIALYYSRARQKRLPSLVALGILAGALMIEFNFESYKYIYSHKQAGWNLFEPTKIPQYVKDGKIVVVNITARWCVNCQINEVSFWSTQKAQALLQQPNIIAMRGDWTYADSTIKRYLQDIQSPSLPVIMIYGPAAPQGIAIKQDILTLRSFLAVLNEVR